MYELQQRIAASHTDAKGRLKLVCAIDMLQDCSQLWLESEPELERFFSEQGIAQFLVSRQADILRLPAYGERVSVRTTVYSCQSFLGYRNTVMYDEAGLPCVTSWSTGAFVVMETGKPARLPEELLSRITMDPKVEMEYLSKKIRLPDILREDERELPPVRVNRHDIDFNRHVNNARYIQIAMEYPDDDFVVSRLRAEYKRPAQFGGVFYPRLLKADSALFISLNNERGEPYIVMELTTHTDNN